jgi:hypothetical protein
MNRFSTATAWRSHQKQEIDYLEELNIAELCGDEKSSGARRD